MVALDLNFNKKKRKRVRRRMTERSWPPDPPSPARPYSFALISLNLTNLGRTHSGIVCQGWSFLIELTPCFDPVNVIRKKKRDGREKNNSRVQKGVFGYSAQKRTKGLLFFFVCVSPCPHVAQVRVRQRALFYTWIHFIQQSAVCFSPAIFSHRG